MSFIAQGKTDSLKIPAGEHIVTITKATLVASKQKGTPGISMMFKDSSGRIASGVLWLTQKGLGFMEAAMTSIGKPVKIGQEFDPQPDDFLGVKARIQVRVNENGFSELESWLPPGGLKPAILDEELSEEEIPF